VVPNVGATVGGGIELGSQLYTTGKVNNWKAVEGSAIQGGIVGGAAGFTGGASLFITAGAAGLANGVGGAANDYVQGKEITASSVGTDIAIGTAFGAAGKYIGNEATQYLNRYSKIGSTGAIGEKALKSLGGDSQVYMQTTLGGRFIDQCVDGIANESKVGYTSLTKNVSLQIGSSGHMLHPIPWQN